MAKKLFRMTVVFLLAVMTYSPALAIAPLGPPTAGLEQGQKRVAFEYGYRKADLKASGFKVSAWSESGEFTFGPFTIPWGGADVSAVPTGSATISDAESNAFIANIGYGVIENWEVYALLGIADVQIDYVEGAEDLAFDGNYRPYFGFGTKLTFRKEEPLSWGAMFQMDWTNSEEDDFFELDIFGSDNVEIQYYEIVVAVGPTYEMNEQLRIYGGPFFYLLDGDFKSEITNTMFYDSGSKISFDLEEDSQVGGYVGAEYDLVENAPLFVELQFTADSWGFGAGIGWKF
jgi:hypothetical protein